MNEALESMIRDIDVRLRAEDPSALDDAVRLAEQHPDETQVWSTLAYAHRKNDNYAAAMAASTRGIEIAPMEPVWFCIRGQDALMAADYESALADFTQGLVLCDHWNNDSYRESFHYLRAEAYVQLGKNAEARADLAHVDDDWGSWTIAVRSKDELLALSAATSANTSEHDPDDLDRQIWKIQGRVRSEDPTALDDAVRLTEQYPDKQKLWRLLAYVNEWREDFVAAAAAATRVMDVAPQHPRMFYDRGRYELQAENFEGAIADFTRGIELCEQLHDDSFRELLYFLRAEAFFQLNRKAEALADLAHVHDQFSAWTVHARTKSSLLRLCGECGDGMPSTDHEYELPETPDEEETQLANKLGPAGLAAIDANLLRQVGHRQLKSARIVIYAIEAGGFSFDDESLFRLHLRRLIALANAGVVVILGNPYWPRFSEVRLP